MGKRQTPQDEGRWITSPEGDGWDMRMTPFVARLRKVLKPSRQVDWKWSIYQQLEDVPRLIDSGTLYSANTAKGNVMLAMQKLKRSHDSGSAMR